MKFLNKYNKPFVLIMLMIMVFFAGCSIFGGKPQKKPQVSKQEIQKSVKEEMQAPETMKIIEDAAKTQKLEELLKTPEADRLIQKEIIDNLDTSQVSIKLQEDLKKALTSPEIQKQFLDHVKKTMDSPEVQKVVSSAVQNAVMKIFQGGAGEGGQSGSDGSGDGSQSGEAGGS